MGAPHPPRPSTPAADRHPSRTLKLVRTATGLALVASGSVLLVLPGPGLLLIGTGIALLPGGRSKLARTRALVEPRARRLAIQLGRWIEARRAADPGRAVASRG